MTDIIRLELGVKLTGSLIGRMNIRINLRVPTKNYCFKSMSTITFSAIDVDS